MHIFMSELQLIFLKKPACQQIQFATLGHEKCCQPRPVENCSGRRWPRKLKSGRRMTAACAFHRAQK